MKSINKYFPKSKKIPIDEFIANALYDKNHGYYSKNVPFGKYGDFVTSPEISVLFSEMLALWTISLWEHLNKPKIFNSVDFPHPEGPMMPINSPSFICVEMPSTAVVSISSDRNVFVKFCNSIIAFY